MVEEVFPHSPVLNPKSKLMTRDISEDIYTRN